MTSKYFGKVVFDNHFNALVCDGKEININDKKIDISLWFDENDTITEKEIQKTDDFFDNIHSILEGIESELKSNFKSKKVVYEYLKHHINEFNDQQLIELGIDENNNELEKINKLFEKLELAKIDIYPTKSICDEFAVFDFTIGYDYTQYVIVVNTKRNGKIVYIDMEG